MDIENEISWLITYNRELHNNCASTEWRLGFLEQTLLICRVVCVLEIQCFFLYVFGKKVVMFILNFQGND